MKRTLLVAIFWSCGLAAGCALADGFAQDAPRAPAGIAVGEALLDARAKLLKFGWKPTRRHADDGYEYSGAELQLTARRIFEVDSCSMDSSRCVLFYTKKGTCLRMDTIGEQLKNMVVTRWVEECPDAPPKPSRIGLPEH